MAEGVDLPDVNVWLALAVADHPHHQRARSYWVEEAHEFVAFCRATALGFLRLTTNASVMGGKPLSAVDAWALYTSFRRLDEVVLANEPEGCDQALGDWVRAGLVVPRLWTDAYLASLARSAGWRLVTFDRDFARFRSVDVLRLEG